MNWHIANFLPEAGGCQDNFNTIIASYITAVYNNLADSSSHPTNTPGHTPVRRFRGSQTPQTPQQVVQKEATDYSKELLSGEMAQKLFL